MIRMAEEDLNDCARQQRLSSIRAWLPASATLRGNRSSWWAERCPWRRPRQSPLPPPRRSTPRSRSRFTEKEPEAPSRLLHKALAAASGAVGGGFGLAALPVELPISTIIMLRSIGDIARSEGEDLADPESALACLQVFALGTRDGEANAAESGYFAARGLLAKSVAEAARFIAERGVLAEGAPVLVRFIAQIASRFGVVVTQKLAAQAVPVIGALGGAAMNYSFIDHFQEVARAHFVVRQLERRYGKDPVRAAYERFSSKTKAAA
jgi:EcsC protein family